MISHAFVLLSVAAWASAQQSLYGQCGGVNWTGATTCVAGATCAYQNDYYSQCVPSSSTASSTKASSTSTSTKASSTTSSKASSATSSSKTSSTSSKSSSTSTSSSKTSSSSTTSASATSSASPTCKVGKTPALGWNSWNAYGGNINEAKVVAAANQFISLGLKDVGYKYINIDDTWSNITGRAANNTILPDYTKFPDGISGTASKVHALGLLFGIYGDAGTATCAGYPGSLGYENIDAATFSSWGVDYLKYDNCNVPSNWTDYWTYTDWGQSNSAIRYRQMGDALKAQSNPILFSLCNWGNANVWQWGATVGQSWRMSGDSSATWSYITSIINSNSAYLDYVNFCGHNDMDMMEIGNGDLTLQEQRSHFAMWVALKSPILLGTDLSLLTADELAIIKNTELLAFSQDTTVGAPAKPYGTATTTPPEYYAGTSAKGVHVFVMNTSSSSSTKTITFADVPGLGSGTWKIHDMWTGTDVGSFSTSWSTTLAAHDTGAWLITAA